MMPINTRGDVAPVPNQPPAPNHPPENPAPPAPIEPQMQNVNVPNDPRGTKRHRDEEGFEAGEPALKRARTESEIESDAQSDVSGGEGYKLCKAIIQGKTELVAALLEQSPQLIESYLPVEGGLTPLCLAAKLGQLEMVRLLVSVRESNNNPADVNAISKSGLTALMCASQRGDAKMISALCRLGAKPEQINPVTGWDALTYAIACKNLEACKTLINNGEDILKTLRIPHGNAQTYNEKPPLAFAILVDFVELIDWWLDKNPQRFGTIEAARLATQMLANAAVHGASSIVKPLLKRGADPYTATINLGHQQLKGVWQIAAHFGRPAVIEYLLSEGYRIHPTPRTISSVCNFLGLGKVADVYIHLAMQAKANTPADRIIDAQLRQCPEKAIEGLAQRYVMTPVTNQNLAIGWWCEQGFLAAPFFNSNSIKFFYACAGVLGKNAFYSERFPLHDGGTPEQHLQMAVEFLSDSICSPEWPQSFSGLKLTPSGEQAMNQIAIAQGELLLRGIAHLRKRFDEQVATLPVICVSMYISVSHQVNEPDLYWRMTREWGLYDPIARAVLRLVKEAYAKLREVKPEAITPKFAAMSLEEQLRHVIVDMLEESDKIPEIVEAIRKPTSEGEFEIVSTLLLQQWRLFCQALGVTKPRFSQFGPHLPAQPEPVMEVDMPEVVTTLDGMANSSSATAFQ